MDEPIALLLAGLLAFVFGWNNSAILIGNERGSGTLSARQSTALCSLGIVLGVALEGSKMRGSLDGTIAGQATDAMVVATLVVTIALTFALTVGAIPVSFSNTMVGAFAGTAFGSSVALRAGDLGTVVAFWLLAPLATAAATVACHGAIKRGTANLNLIAMDRFNRAGVGLVSLALAYVLSANNVGLIYGTAFDTAQGASQGVGASLPLAVALGGCAIVAMAAFGRGGVAGTVGDRLVSLSPREVLSAFSATIIMMWLATQLAIPISVSQCLIGGMLGAALTKKVAIVNRRLALEVVASWAAVPLVAFVLAAALVPFL
ncbi:MAG TPA: inorganic phosphate transporter [Nitrososphaerales archaeon]|nr:inorganic phosphate transporter [Nitrososphaerales archaeon]